MDSIFRLTVGVAALCVLAACQPKTADTTARPPTSAAEVLIGATLPLSGALAGFGSFQKWGYEHAVAEVNAGGGVRIEGTPRKVRLIIRDDRTDANVAASNVDTLVSADHVDALLGSCTPPLVIAASLAAERNATPLVTGCAPLMSFTAAKHWQWAWDLFFNEQELSEAPFKAWQDLHVASNHKIVILHDNGADGSVVGGRLWPALAAKYGYQVVANLEFPIDTTDFSASVQQVRSAGADVLMVDAVTPQIVSIRKQLASAGYTPRLLVMEKGAEPTQFAEAVGALADGVLVGGYWDASFIYPGAAELGTAFARETKRTVSQHIADSYTAARVLLDALASAGSVDKTKLNAAIAATDRVYPVGPVKFAADHTAALGIAELQWQGGATKVIWPVAQKTAAFMVPVPAP
jgi:branched-chain amino acid transport system substrate-binding protein